MSDFYQVKVGQTVVLASGNAYDPVYFNSIALVDFNMEEAITAMVVKNTGDNTISEGVSLNASSVESLVDYYKEYYYSELSHHIHTFLIEEGYARIEDSKVFSFVEF